MTGNPDALLTTDTHHHILPDFFWQACDTCRAVIHSSGMVYMTYRAQLGTVSADAVGTIAAAAREGMVSLADVDKKITGVGQLQFDARKRMAEVEKKESHDLGEALAKGHEKAAQAVVVHTRSLMTQASTLQFIEAQAAKARAIDEQGLCGQAALQITLNDARRQPIAIYENIFSGESKMSAEMARLLPQLDQETTKTVHLSAARKVLITVTQEGIVQSSRRRTSTRVLMGIIIENC